MRARLSLAATCHDPAGRFAAGVADAGALWALTHAVAVNATAETHPDTVEALRHVHPTAVIARHRAGSIGIGTARRDALAAALATGCTHVLYSDLDHVLRWASSAPDELTRTVTPEPGVDLTVIGRSASAFAAEPDRLRLTESAVNRAAGLAIGAATADWDFMIAIRLMTAAAARELVSNCAEQTIGNDVAWPLHLHRAGLQVGYRAVDGLAYRHRDDFGAATDRRDANPEEWVRRLEIAAQHAAALRPYLGSGVGP